MTTLYVYCIKEAINSDGQFDLINDDLINEELGDFLETLNNGSMRSDIPYMFRDWRPLPKAEIYYERINTSERLKKYINTLKEKNPNINIYYYTGEQLKKIINILSKEYYSKELFEFRYKEEKDYPTPEGEYMKIPTEEEYETLEKIIEELNYIYLNIKNSFDIETARFIFYSYEN